MMRQKGAAAISYSGSNIGELYMYTRNNVQTKRYDSDA